MMGDDVLHGDGHVWRGWHLQQHRLTEVLRRRKSTRHEPALNRREWHKHPGRRHHRCRGALQRMAGKRRNRLMINQLLRRDSQTRSLGTSDDLKAANRIAAELEEVVVHAEGLDPQHVAPDFARSFRWASAARRGARAARHVASGAGSAARSSLPLGVSGKPSSHTTPRAPCSRGAASAGRCQLAERGPARRRAARDTRPAAGASLAAGHDHRLATPRVRRARFDLAELDAEAADLHLVIDPAQELQRPLGPPPREIAGAIQPRARRAEGIGDEPVRRQCRPAQIAAPEARRRRCTAPRPRPTGTGRDRIEDVELRIGNRPADWRRALVPAADVNGIS